MIRIHEPVHGAVLNRRHGVEGNRGLRISVRGTAPLDAVVEVNGVPATRSGEQFQADVTLDRFETEIRATARSRAGTGEHAVRVWWDRASFPRYGFGIDDNSFFLRDIARRRPRSIFACFYLDILRRLHEEYGTKFVLNLFFTTPEEDFSLDSFPEDYCGEWRDNAEWLRLSFHARREFPDRPYQYASPRRLAEDFDRVKAEIIRFAGEETWVPPAILHWGMAPPACRRVLRERGVRVLSGYFRPLDDSGIYDVNYLVDEIRSEYVCRHDALMDVDSGIVFSRVDLVCNTTPASEIPGILDSLASNPDTAEIMDVMTHEQYFWPFYRNHLPDHADRLETAIRWLAEHGYAPVHLCEGFLGNPNGDHD